MSGVSRLVRATLLPVAAYLHRHAPAVDRTRVLTTYVLPIDNNVQRYSCQGCVFFSKQTNADTRISRAYYKRVQANGEQQHVVACFG